jgi:hypothetical protein
MPFRMGANVSTEPAGLTLFGMAMASKQKRKRERNKRARRRPGPRTNAGQRQGVSLGPLELVLEGKEVSMRVNPDHPDFERFRAAQIAQADATPKTVLELREKIAELCEGYHAFDVILAVWWTYGVVRADTLRPIESEGSTRTAEYVAHVLLDRESPEPSRMPTQEEMQTTVDPSELGELVTQILAGMPIWFQHRQSEDHRELDPWLDLRTRFYMHRLVVSSFTYEWQERATLRELFGPFDEQLSEALGFTVAQALDLFEALGNLVQEGAAERGARARESAAKMRAAVASVRAGGDVGEELFPEFAAQLAQLPARDAERWIDSAAISWMGFGLGRDASLTAAELADAAGTSVEVASAFLDAFAVDFGAREDQERWAQDPAKAVGSEMETMRRRPILHDGEGSYLPAGIDTVFYGIRDVLTDGLKNTKDWNRFDRRRSEILERRAVAALDSALQADWSHGGITYRYVDDRGKEQEGEADGVLRAGTVLVLVESKAGGLAPSARRAAPARLERGLKDLVVEAHDQLGRSYAALVEGRATKITDADGKPLQLDLDGVNRTLRIAVSLEDLSPVAPAIWQLQEAGLLSTDERAPWVVGVHELELICELSESPGQLVHYVLRRQRANRQHLWAMDEMDFFMKYLDDGLFFEDEEVEKRDVSIHSHTDRLDEYLYGEQGIRPKAKRPKQKIDNATRELLGQIASTGSAAAIEAQVMILEMSTESRKQVSAGMRKLARMTRADGQPHDLTLLFEGDFAVTIHSVPPGREDDLPDRLATHGRGRSEKSNLRRWLGIGVVASDKPRLAAMAVMLDPSRLDE